MFVATMRSNCWPSCSGSSRCSTMFRSCGTIDNTTPGRTRTARVSTEPASGGGAMPFVAAQRSVRHHGLERLLDGEIRKNGRIGREAASAKQLGALDKFGNRVVERSRRPHVVRIPLDFADDARHQLTEVRPDLLSPVPR